MSEARPDCRCVLCVPPPREFGDSWVHEMLGKVRDDGVLEESRRVQPTGWLPAAQASSLWSDLLDE